LLLSVVPPVGCALDEAARPNEMLGAFPPAATASMTALGALMLDEVIRH
jgi:hypothetical protein